MSLKILIIDDNEMDLELLTEYLNRAGFDRVLTALNGKEGIEIAKSERPDVNLIDTNMPLMNGFEVTRAIREELMNESKIIIMTGAVKTDDEKRAKQCGADGYCMKTMDYDQIVMELKKIQEQFYSHN